MKPISVTLAHPMGLLPAAAERHQLWEHGGQQQVNGAGAGASCREGALAAAPRARRRGAAGRTASLWAALRAGAGSAAPARRRRAGGQRPNSARRPA